MYACIKLIELSVYVFCRQMGGALPVKIVNVTIVLIVLSIVKLLLRGGTRDELPWGRRE